MHEAPARDRAVSVSLPGPLGVDVSAYQGHVDWKKLAAAGDRFAIVKATEGTSYRSPLFAEQYGGSYDAGMIRGAYVFAVPNNSSGAAQADYFVAHGGGWSGDGRTLPGMLDIEYNPYGSECYGLSKDQMVRWVTSFDDEYARLTGRYPLLYTNAHWWDTCTGGSAVASNDPLDVAAWGPTAGTMPGGWPFETIWQYTDSNSFHYDGDSFNGSAAGLSAIALGHAAGGGGGTGGGAPSGGSSGSPGRADVSIGTTLGAGHVLRTGQQLVSANNRYRVIMQRDGNMVLYNPHGRSLWSSRTDGHPGAWARMTTGGNLVVVAPTGRRVWESRTAGRGSSYATVQDDGDFSIYRYDGGGTWTSRTAGMP